MDRSTSDRDKSSKRSRDDRDRDSGRDHREREHKHRSRDSSSHNHHHRSERDDQNRDRDHHRKSSSKREDREGSRDREIKIEQSMDLRDDREGSRERVERPHDRRRRDERERSHDGRDEREGSRDRYEKPREREVKRERSYDGKENEEQDDGSKRKRKDREGSGDERDKKEARVSHGRRERRKFGDKVKEEDDVDDGDNSHAPDNLNTVQFGEVKVKDEPIEESMAGGSAVNGGFPAVTGAASRSLTEPWSVAGSSVAPEFSVPSKVSSIPNTNENKGVSVTRSHEVPGKSSTDGTSSIAGKSGSSSLDALAKAKKAIEMKKDIEQRLQRLRANKANKSSSGGMGGKDGVNLPSSSASAQVSGASTTATFGVSATATPTLLGQATGGLPHIPGLNSIPNYEAVRRAQELAAKMGFRQDPDFGPLINLFPGQMQTDVAVPQKPTKAPVLRVDALGREIDEHGNVVNVTKPSNLSTLKVNINKQKKDAFQILKPELEVDPDSNPHFDARMGIDKVKLLRPKRMSFQFVEEGKWSKDAETIKLRNQFGEERARDMKARQALHAKAKAAPDINPNLIEVGERVMTKEKAKEPIPEVEWWDVALLVVGAYGEIEDGVVQDNQLKMEKITMYVEHPRPIEPPAEVPPPPPQPLKLTKKEQKKLRTQRRLGREKDRQEMIRQGLLEPPKPKVKMSNLMRVLGSEATQDPTKLEKEVRSAAAEREQAHIDRNIARKLTPSERREKKERKLFDDPNTVGTMVSVYRVNDLSHKKTRFKVDVNASHNHMTGCCVISEGISVVVVEGGSKSIKRYGNLMLRRINWAEAVNEDEGGEGGGGDNEDKPANKCVLVWQGIVAKPSFNRFSVHECMTEAAARKIFADAGVVQYWDLAVNFSDDM